MDIDVRINKINTTGNVKATASVTLDDCFGIRGVKVMEGKNGLFINMPSYKGSDEKYKDICFPTTAEFRQELIAVACEEPYHFIFVSRRRVVLLHQINILWYSKYLDFFVQ